MPTSRPPCCADPYRVDFQKSARVGGAGPKPDHNTDATPAGRILTPLPDRLTCPAFFDHIKTAEKWWVVLAGGDHAALLEQPRGKMLQAIDSFIQSLATK